MNIGREVVRLGEVDSTNIYAERLAENEAPHGTVVIADSQTRGKGRLGRLWISPPGGIYMSIILRPRMELKDSTLLTIMAGVACCRALRDVTGLDLEIKWPNDLIVSGRKLGGILTEVKSRAHRIEFVIIGIGINVNVLSDGFPSEVREIATSIRNEMLREQPKDALILALLNEVDRWYDILMEKGGRPVLEEWRKFAAMLGKTVKVTVGKDELVGVAEDIDGQGLLIMRLPSGAVRKISAGDLTILREQ